MMTLEQLIVKAIEDGIKSVQEQEHDPRRLAGYLAGFEICRSLQGPKDYADVLSVRHREEVEFRWQNDDVEGYWEYRCATIQIEWCYEIMKVALRMYPLSSRAIHYYQKVMGEFL